MIPRLADLYRLTCATFEGDPLAIFAITGEDQAWLYAAEAYLQRQYVTEGLLALTPDKESPC